MSDNKPNFETPLDNEKFILWGERWSKDSKTPSLQVRVFNNNVALLCWPRHPSEVNTELEKKPILARMGPIDFRCFINLLYEAIDKKEPGHTTLVTNTKEGVGTPITPQSKVQVGRGDDGILYIGIAVKGREPMKFKFINSIWFHFEKKNGDKLTAEEASDRVARAWIETVAPIVNMVLLDFYVDKQTVMRVRKEAQQRRVSEKSESNLNSGGYNEDSFSAS